MDIGYLPKVWQFKIVVILAIWVIFGNLITIKSLKRQGRDWSDIFYPGNYDLQFKDQLYFLPLYIATYLILVYGESLFRLFNTP